MMHLIHRTVDDCCIAVTSRVTKTDHYHIAKGEDPIHLPDNFAKKNIEPIPDLNERCFQLHWYTVYLILCVYIFLIL